MIPTLVHSANDAENELYEQNPRTRSPRETYILHQHHTPDGSASKSKELRCTHILGTASCAHFLLTFAVSLSLAFTAISVLHNTFAATLDFISLFHHRGIVVYGELRVGRNSSGRYKGYERHILLEHTNELILDCELRGNLDVPPAQNPRTRCAPPCSAVAHDCVSTLLHTQRPYSLTEPLTLSNVSSFLTP